MRSVFLALALALTPAAALAIATPTQIQIVTNHAYENPSHHDPEQVITAALTARGYVISAHQPGSVEAYYSARGVRADIRVTYTDTAYSIEYVDSQGLRYDGTHIDPHYNHWVHNLDSDLQIAFAAP